MAKRKTLGQHELGILMTKAGQSCCTGFVFVMYSTDAVSILFFFFFLGVKWSVKFILLRVIYFVILLYHGISIYLSQKAEVQDWRHDPRDVHLRHPKIGTRHPDRPRNNG
jgi:hypothetical protein